MKTPDRKAAPRRWRFRTCLTGLGLIAGLGVCLSCDRKPESPATTTKAKAQRPNILWVVWDTVRADHLSLYGYKKSTTPKLDEWAKQARVFDDCVSAASSTVPSHASMFTGLLPGEHDANNSYNWLSDSYTTIAELLHGTGYQTYLFAANPHVSRDENFNQGFEKEDHPWDPAFQAEAEKIVRSKLRADDRSSELLNSLNSKKRLAWDIKACGELAQSGLENWLDHRDKSRPYFAFLNYMEAHRPYITPPKYRERMMSPAMVERSYKVDASWVTLWRYTLGLHDYSPDDLDALAGTYDACLLELDDLFDQLLNSLRERGDLDNTIIVLVADHGEQLGEHHMLDHQFSLYNPLVQVPLVVFDPQHFPAGRERRPVMSFDLFPTLLELASVRSPATKAVSLRSPQENRLRLAVYPSPFLQALEDAATDSPGWNPKPWMRQLRALYSAPYKLIAGSDGRNELYDVVNDVAEMHDLAGSKADVLRTMMGQLENYAQSLSQPLPRTGKRPGQSGNHADRLKALGYLGGGDTPPATTSAPASQHRR